MTRHIQSVADTFFRPGHFFPEKSVRPDTFYLDHFFVTAIAANDMASSSVPASFQPPQLSAKPFDSGNESDGSDESDAMAIVGDIAFGDQIDDGVTGSSSNNSFVLLI